MKSVADVLAAAREYIEKHGWCRGEIENREKQVCAYGGLLYGNDWLQESLTIAEREVLTECQNLLTDQAQKLHPHITFIESVPDWNDRLAADKQEILDVFMAAEKAARSGNVED